MLKDYITNHNKSLESIASESVIQSWTAARDVLVKALQTKNKILIAGNGGSAADAQHLAAEFVGRFVRERQGYPAIALTTDSSAITAIGNDYGFEQVFARQIQALGQEGDCFIAISTSGNSMNILLALVAARKKGIATILLTGKDGGMAREFADISLIVPGEVTAHIQEAHLVLYHAWCKSVEDILAEKDDRQQKSTESVYMSSSFNNIVESDIDKPALMSAALQSNIDMKHDSGPIQQYIATFPKARILVVGDLMVDHYSYGVVSRISPEAPVPIIHIAEEKFIPGGAGNVCANLVDLGASVTLAAVVGNDRESDIARRSLQSIPQLETVLETENGRRTTIKHRLVAGQQQLLRVDTEDTHTINSETEKVILDHLTNIASQFDGICVSDYGKGMMTPRLASLLVDIGKKLSIPVLVDTKPKNFHLYKGCTILTPNELEVTTAYPDSDCIQAAYKLAHDLHAPVLVTRGAKGALFVNKTSEEQFELPGYARGEEVRDVSGAGDTFAAALLLSIVARMSMKDAAYVASRAAAISVTKPHTSTVTRDELLAVL